MVLESHGSPLTEELPGLRRLAENTPTICAEFHQEGGQRSSLLKPRWLATVAPDTATVHTPTMTLKNTALLALIGTVLMTALLVWNFVFNLLNLLRGLVPAVTLFSSFIYAFGCFSVMVFFFVFHRTQS
jgi:hypothetical protein